MTPALKFSTTTSATEARRRVTSRASSVFRFSVIARFPATFEPAKDAAE